MSEVVRSRGGSAPSWLKVVFAGDHGVGKTTLIKRICEGKFTAAYNPTVGVDYGYHLVEISDNCKVDVTFWDFAGGGEFFEVRKHLYSSTSICFIVYDATSKASLESIKPWLGEVKSHTEEAQIVVLANKCDLVSHVTPPPEALLQKYSMRFFKVSAKTGDGVTASLLEAIAATLPMRPAQVG